MDFEKTIKVIFTVWIAYVAIALVVTSLVAYVVYHFISKLW